MKIQLLTAFIAVVGIGCSPDPVAESATKPDPAGSLRMPVWRTDSSIGTGGTPRGSGRSASSDANPKQTKDAVNGIRSYLVDLEGELRVGPVDTWQMKSSAARHIVGNIRIEIDHLARAGLGVGALRSGLDDLSGSLANASEANWNNLVSSGRDSINDIRAALTRLEKDR